MTTDDQSRIDRLKEITGRLEALSASPPTLRAMLAVYPKDPAIRRCNVPRLKEPLLDFVWREQKAPLLLMPSMGFRGESLYRFEYRGDSIEKTRAYIDAVAEAFSLLGLDKEIEGDSTSHVDFTWRALHLAESDVIPGIQRNGHQNRLGLLVPHPSNDVQEEELEALRETHYLLSCADVARLAVDAIDYLLSQRKRPS